MTAVAVAAVVAVVAVATVAVAAAKAAVAMAAAAVATAVTAMAVAKAVAAAATDGNAIQLLWLFESTSEPKRTMVQGGRKLGRNFKFLSSPVREKCEAHNSTKPENFFYRTDPYIWFLHWHHSWETRLQ